MYEMFLKHFRGKHQTTLEQFNFNVSVCKDVRLKIFYEHNITIEKKTTIFYNIALYRIV